MQSDGKPMTYKIEQIDNCTKKLIFSFETLDFSSEINQALEKKRESVSLKGFRKGKAPMSLIENMYKGQVEIDVLNQFVNNKLFEAIDDEKLRVVGQPTMEDLNYDPGKSMSFNAVVEIFPEIEVKSLEGLTFDKDKVDVSDEELERSMKQYLESKAEMKEITEDVALENGQFAVLNFEGEKEDGEKPENMKGSEFLLEIGSGQFIPGFEEGMVGMKKTDKKTIEVTFPEEYHAEDLKGKPVKFHVELLEIKQKEYPELNDDLAKEFQFESAEDMKNKTRDNLVQQKDRGSKDKLNQDILQKLCEENKFDIPKAMIESQKQSLKEDLARNLKQQGFNDNMMEEYFDKWASDMDEKAAFQVQSGLILDKLANQFSVEVNESDFEAKLAEVAAGANLDVEQVKQFYGADPKVKSNMMYSLREEKTFEKIYEAVTINEK